MKNEKLKMKIEKAPSYQIILSFPSTPTTPIAPKLFSAESH